MNIWLVRALHLVAGCGVGTCIGYPLAKREVRKRNTQIRREAIGMNVTELIEKLQAVATDDPTIEVVAGIEVDPFRRLRSVEGVVYADSSTLQKPVAIVVVSPSFIDLAQGKK